MSALVSFINTAGLHRVVLESSSEGVYCFGFEGAGSPPKWDYLQDTWTLDKEFCLEEWGAPLGSWEPTDEHHNSG